MVLVLLVVLQLPFVALTASAEPGDDHAVALTRFRLPADPVLYPLVRDAVADALATKGVDVSNPANVDHHLRLLAEGDDVLRRLATPYLLADAFEALFALEPTPAQEAIRAWFDPIYGDARFQHALRTLRAWEYFRDPTGGLLTQPVESGHTLTGLIDHGYVSIDDFTPPPFIPSPSLAKRAEVAAVLGDAFAGSDEELAAVLRELDVAWDEEHGRNVRGTLVDAGVTASTITASASGMWRIGEAMQAVQAAKAAKLKAELAQKAWDDAVEETAQLIKKQEGKPIDVARELAKQRANVKAAQEAAETAAREAAETAAKHARAAGQKIRQAVGKIIAKVFKGLKAGLRTSGVLSILSVAVDVGLVASEIIRTETYDDDLRAILDEGPQRDHDFRLVGGFKDDYDAGLYYERCRDGFHGVATVCYEDCPSGSTDTGLFCQYPAESLDKHRIPRNPTPLGCATGQEEQAGLCYDRCQDGYVGGLTRCYGECPTGDGWRTDPLTCFKPADTNHAVHSSEAACLEYDYNAGCYSTTPFTWYPECPDGWRSVGLHFCTVECPPGFSDGGRFCNRPSYDRGVGVPLSTCADHLEQIGALCYVRCPAGYDANLVECIQPLCPDGYESLALTCYRHPFADPKETYDRGAGTATPPSAQVVSAVEVEVFTLLVDQMVPEPDLDADDTVPLTCTADAPAVEAPAGSALTLESTSSSVCMLSVEQSAAAALMMSCTFDPDLYAQYVGEGCVTPQVVVQRLAPALVGGAIDATPPVITVDTSGLDGDEPWFRPGDVVTWLATDDLDDDLVVEPTPLEAEGDRVVVTSPVVCDAAGNCNQARRLVRVDGTPPTVELAMPDKEPTGYHLAPFVVTPVCTDEHSGVATCPAPITIDTEGTHHVAVEAVDVAGNTAGAWATIYLDLHAPTLTLDAEADGSVVPAAEEREPTCEASDPFAGLKAPCSIDVVREPGEPGTETVTVTATVTDHAERTTTVTRTYTAVLDPLAQVAARLDGAPAQLAELATTATGRDVGRLRRAEGQLEAALAVTPAEAASTGEEAKAVAVPLARVVRALHKVDLDGAAELRDVALVALRELAVAALDAATDRVGAADLQPRQRRMAERHLERGRRELDRAARHLAAGRVHAAATSLQRAVVRAAAAEG